MKIEKKNIPLPATAAKHTSEIKTVEELYFNGLHIELIMLLPIIMKKLCVTNGKTFAITMLSAYGI